MCDERSQWEIKVDAMQRLIMWYGLSRIIRYYLVTEYPKSGGSWFSQMLSAYLEIPFPRNRRPSSFLEPCVLQGHYLYSPFLSKNIFCVIRDGRDVMVSAYYHFLVHSDRNIPWAVKENRRAVPFDDYENTEKNLPLFIEYMFTRASRGIFHFRWDKFIYSWIDKDVALIRYENLLENTVDALCAAIYNVTGKEPDTEKLHRVTQRFSFENLTGRKRGEEDTRSFVRKGVAGDWKEKFSRDACQVFDYYAGEALIAAGYETDRSWIDDCGH